MAHITAYGGTKKTGLFRGAIAQSPYFLPTYPLPSSKVEAVLRFGKVASVDKLRSMSSTELQKLNALLVGNSQPFGTFTLGIVPDNDYVPNLPSKLSRQGRFDHTLSVMTSHNQDEGSRFIESTVVTSDSSYVAYLKSLITPLADNISALDRITQVLYPPIYDSSKGYTNQVQRNNLTIADATFVCNARAMQQANFDPRTYAYVFSAPPAAHGADLPHTFYDSGPVSDINTTVAEIMQRYITWFAETG
ncbi:MAG: hypothetical protein Q9201_005570 [Fulgogasparrea decipioides]